MIGHHILKQRNNFCILSHIHIRELKRRKYGSHLSPHNYHFSCSPFIPEDNLPISMQPENFYSHLSVLSLYAVWIPLLLISFPLHQSVRWFCFLHSFKMSVLLVASWTHCSFLLVLYFSPYLFCPPSTQTHIYIFNWNLIGHTIHSPAVLFNLL